MQLIEIQTTANGGNFHIVGKSQQEKRWRLKVKVHEEILINVPRKKRNPARREYKPWEEKDMISFVCKVDFPASWQTITK